MRDVIDRVSDYFDSNRDTLVGLYLYGSSIAGGLQHESDIDLLAVTHRSPCRRENVSRSPICCSASPGAAQRSSPAGPSS